MTHNRTPFLPKHATIDIIKSVKPLNAIEDLNLKNVSEVMELWAYKNMSYKPSFFDSQQTNNIMQKYLNDATKEQLVGNWCWSVLRACVDQKTCDYGNIRFLLDSFPVSIQMSDSHTKLEYNGTTIFEGSAWDLLMDLLIIPQVADQTDRLSHSIIKWLNNPQSHHINEKFRESPAIKAQYLWECIAQRSDSTTKVFNKRKAAKDSAHRLETKRPVPRTALCDVVPHLFRDEEFALQMMSSELFQQWIKHVALTSPLDLSKMVDSIIGAPFSPATKEQLGRHLRSFVGDETMRWVLELVPRQKIIQGLWKSYFTFAKSCGIPTPEAMALHRKDFKAAVLPNATNALLLDRFLPVFQNAGGFECELSELPFTVWRKSKLEKTPSMEPAWAVLQKYNMVPLNLNFQTINNALKNTALNGVVDPFDNEVRHAFDSVVQNHRLHDEIMNAVESDPPTVSVRRRM